MLMDKEYEIIVHDNQSLYVHDLKLWRVGLMLPCYWGSSTEKYYCFLTDNGHSLNSSLQWDIIS